MQHHALELVALRQLIDISAQVEVQLTTAPRPSVSDLPVLAILAKAREDAAGAMISLCETNPDDATAIRLLQNEVVRFKDLVKWLRAIVIEGHQADAVMDDVRRGELQNLVLGIDEETLAKLGLKPPGAGSE